MRPALQETVLEWRREWQRIGREEGRRQGALLSLTHLLEVKFGVLRPEDRVRVGEADMEQLMAWAERLLTARSLDEVFND